MNETNWANLIRITKSELQSEFNEKNRAIHKRVSEASDRIEKATDQIMIASETMGKLAAKLDAEISHRPDDGEIRDIVDNKLEQQRRRCREQQPSSHDIQKLSSSMNHQPSAKDDSTIRINISGMKPLQRWIIYALIASGMVGGGHYSGRLLENAIGEVPKTSTSGDKQ